MPIRSPRVDEATLRARRQLDEAVHDLVVARHNAGLSQAAIARVIGVSRPLVAAWEHGAVRPRADQLARWGAVVGRDVSLRTFLAGPALRDAGQLRILDRFRRLIGTRWTCRSEVPVTGDPAERRAFDLVLTRDERRVAVEAVGRLSDAQGQVRPILLKQSAAGGLRVVLVLADSRHNRMAIRSAASTLEPAFPCSARLALAALRAGEVPPQDAVILV
jgi:transcriptional regulator with XRE-family HTH domain